MGASGAPPLLPGVAVDCERKDDVKSTGKYLGLKFDDDDPLLAEG